MSEDLSPKPDRFMVAGGLKLMRSERTNLGPAIDLRDKSLCWDGMHLTEEGNRRIALALSQPVVDLLQN
jgi:lysophospholipase L1-like esterase